MLRSPANAQTAMRALSRRVSATAFAMMIGGLFWAEAGGRTAAWPGIPVKSLAGLLSPAAGEGALMLMSAGIALLCLLPGLALVRAIGIQVRSRRYWDVGVTAIVILELLAGIAGIGH